MQWHERAIDRVSPPWRTSTSPPAKRRGGIGEPSASEGDGLTVITQWIRAGTEQGESTVALITSTALRGFD